MDGLSNPRVGELYKLYNLFGLLIQTFLVLCKQLNRHWLKRGRPEKKGRICYFFIREAGSSASAQTESGWLQIKKYMYTYKDIKSRLGSSLNKVNN